jgi:hypothetical protein
MRYVRPAGENDLYFGPRAAELVGDTRVTVIFVESPKSVLALTALAERTGRRWLVIATGGCDGWRCKVGVETAADGSRIAVTGPHRDLDCLILKARDAIIAFDSNAASNPHVRRAKSEFGAELHRRGALVRMARVPARRGVNGPDDLVAVLGDVVALEVIEKARQRANADASPWEAAASIDMEEHEEPVDFIEEPVLARGAVTELAGPRGLGKSNYARWLAVKHARAGRRVLYRDRDNPPRMARQALRDWGAAGIPTLKLLTRDKVPALLGNDAAWKAFPVREYDFVLLDGWDSTAEGAGERDSRLPSIAISRILDIAHAEDGPSVLILMNTVRDGSHSRCSGVVEDRADAIFEARDLTGFAPTGGPKPWWEEMPVIGAKDWAVRASRRRERERTRMALVPSKFKLGGPEPSPFALEMDFTTSPWSIKDVTHEIDAEGVAERDRRAKEKSQSITEATDALAAEILRRVEAGEPPLLKDRDAVPLLMASRLTQKLARDVVNNPKGRWVLIPLQGEKGHPVALILPGKNQNDDGYDGLTGGAEIAGETNTHFRQWRKEPAKEIDPSQTRESTGCQMTAISVDDSLFTPPGRQNGPDQAGGEDDDTVRL